MTERKKPGRKPRVIDLATYVCPRCKKINGKEPRREMCPECYVEYGRTRAREWHRKHKGKGHQQVGRPATVTGWDRKKSSRWLSLSLIPRTE